MRGGLVYLWLPKQSRSGKGMFPETLSYDQNSRRQAFARAVEEEIPLLLASCW